MSTTHLSKCVPDHKELFHIETFLRQCRGDRDLEWLFFTNTFLNILYFFEFSCTNIFQRRSRYTFYWYDYVNLWS